MYGLQVDNKRYANLLKERINAKFNEQILILSQQNRSGPEYIASKDISKNSSQHRIDTIQTAASYLREDISTYVDNLKKIVWPPTIEQLSADERKPPESVRGFFETVLKQPGRCQNTNVSRLVDSYSQDLVHGVTKGKTLPLLAPLLFLLYQNNLSNTITHSKIATFADDTKIYKVINTEAGAYAMQNDLANFQSSSTKANLLLNTDKCKTLHITRKHNKINHTYKLQDTTLKTTDCKRDLGVWTSSTLTWSKQVLHQCAQASKSLGYIRRSTIKIKTISVRRTLYLTLVRTHLAYASQVWAPQYVDLIKRTERVQRRASKYILDLPFVCNINYNKRLSILKLLPLCYWHEFLDVLFLFKSHYDIINLSSDILPNPQYSSQHTRSANPNVLQFQISSCKTVTYQKSYLLRTTRVWNILPRDLTNNDLTFKVFKKKLFNYYSSALDNCYDVDDPRTWKSVCIKCNQARDLTRPITCCF